MGGGLLMGGEQGEGCQPSAYGEQVPGVGPVLMLCHKKSYPSVPLVYIPYNIPVGAHPIPANVTKETTQFKRHIAQDTE